MAGSSTTSTWILFVFIFCFLSKEDDPLQVKQHRRKKRIVQEIPELNVVPVHSRTLGAKGSRNISHKNRFDFSTVSSSAVYVP